jgi:single-strand DNA-binding protein
MTPSQQQVATFSIATSESWPSKDGQKAERTEWHRIVVWGRQAEMVSKYLKKGRMVYLEGRLQTRSWDDAQSGQKKFMTEVVANQVVFVDSGARGGNEGSPEVGDSYGEPSGGNSYASNASSGGGYDNPSPRTSNTRSEQSPSNSGNAPSFKASDYDDDVPF